MTAAKEGSQVSGCSCYLERREHSPRRLEAREKTFELRRKLLSSQPHAGLRLLHLLKQR